MATATDVQIQHRQSTGTAHPAATDELVPDTLGAAPPDVLVVDISECDANCVDRVAGVMAAHAEIATVAVGAAGADDVLVGLVQAGVSGFVGPDAGFDELSRTVRAVAAGGKVLPARMAEALFTAVAAHDSAPDRSHSPDGVHMTRREHEVIDLIGAGHGNATIASRLNISEHTVKSHVRNVMEKLSLHTRLQIAAYTHDHTHDPTLPHEQRA